MQTAPEAARAFVESLPSRPPGDLSHAVPVRTADLVPLLAALLAAERAAVREAYRELLFRAEEDAPTRDAAVALGRFAEAMLALPLE